MRREDNQVSQAEQLKNRGVNIEIQVLCPLNSAPPIRESIDEFNGKKIQKVKKEEIS